MNARVLTRFQDTVGVVAEGTELVVHVSVEHLDPDISLGHALDRLFVETLAHAAGLVLQGLDGGHDFGRNLAKEEVFNGPES